MLSKYRIYGKLAVLLFCFSGEAVANDVVVDEGVALSKEELAFLVSNWTPDMQQAAANDLGDRIELLSIVLGKKKLAARAPSIPREDNPEAYWRKELSIVNIQSDYVVKHYIANLDVPDMSALAAERYETEKDKYALVPEERYASHILLLCAPGACDRDARRIEAQEILAELQAGADFRELATQYSEDPGSKDKGGQFDRWIKLGSKDVDPHFVGGVYEIEQKGDISEIVDTRFGLHIIRLDDIHEAYYKPFEEVKDQIVASLEQEYIKLSAKELDAQLRLTDKAYIDGDAMEEIFAPYKSAETTQ